MVRNGNAVMINPTPATISGQAAVTGSIPPDDPSSVQGFQSIIESALSDLMVEPQALIQQLANLEPQLDPELYIELKSLLETGNIPPTAATLSHLKEFIQALPALVEGELPADEVALTAPTINLPDDLIQRLRDPNRQPLQLSRIDNLTDSVRTLISESSPQISAASNSTVSNITAGLPEKFNLLTSVEPEVAEVSATVRQAVVRISEQLNLNSVTPTLAPGVMSVSRSSEISHLVHSLPTIPMPPGEKGWDQAVGDRVLWMVGNKIQQAEVKINPPHLGPIDIKVSIQNDQTSVSFAAQHAVTREAIEASLPRLREMFGESNFNLVNVDVGQRGAMSREGSKQTTDGSARADTRESEENTGTGGGDQSAQLLKSHGILDIYA